MTVQRVAGQLAELLGVRLGNFTIEQLMGAGAMGAVYLGRHSTLQSRAAIKVLHPELSSHPSLVQRFVEEARSVSDLGHPGLVRVFDFGTLSDGRPYFVMEHLEGEDLEQLLARTGPLDPARRAPRPGSAGANRLRHQCPRALRAITRVFLQKRLSMSSRSSHRAGEWSSW